jgi:hypothetical protein
MTMTCDSAGPIAASEAKSRAEAVCPTSTAVSGVGDAAYFSSCPSFGATAYTFIAVKGNRMISIQFQGTLPAAQDDAVKAAKGVLSQL